MKNSNNCGLGLNDEQKVSPQRGQNCDVVSVDVCKRRDVLSIVGFCFSVVGLLINAVAIFMALANPNLAAVLFLLIGVVLGDCVGGLGIVLSLIGLIITVKKQKRGKLFAVAGVVIGILCLSLMAIYSVIQ